MSSFTPHDLAAWCRGTWTRVPAADLCGISTDSRALPPGSLFVALRGPRFDGHRFVEEALAHGAASAVVERAALAGLDRAAPLLVVEDTGRALQDLAAGHRRRLALRLLAVTGSVGKTTVKEMTADLLAGQALTARSRGNWNNDIGLPLSMLELAPEHRFGVFELGMNHPGELRPLCRLLQPDEGVITTLGPVHIEFFPSVRAIAEEKAELFRSLPSDGLAFTSRDEAHFEILRAAARCRLVTTSLREPADYQATPLGPAGNRMAVTERESGERAELELSLPGEHVMRNALLAVAVGRTHGLAWDLLAQALRRYRPPPLRWTRVAWAGLDVINDAYNANPLSMRAALRTFAGWPARGGKWLVLGDMLELGATAEAEHRALGAEIAAGAWVGLVAVGELGAWIAGGAVDAGFPAARVVRCADACSAGRVLRERAAPGDAVLLKASRRVRLEEALDDMAADAAGAEADAKSKG